MKRNQLWDFVKDANVHREKCALYGPYYLLRGLSSYFWSLHCSGSWDGSVSDLSLSGVNGGIAHWLWELECQLIRRITTKDLDSHFLTVTVPTLWRMDHRSTGQGAGVECSHGSCNNPAKKFWKLLTESVVDKGDVDINKSQPESVP